MVGPLDLRERLNKLSTAETIQKWHAARGVRMCIDIQLSCQLALSQARKALPFEPACEAYAVKKLSSFHAWFTLRQTFVFIRNKNMFCYHICLRMQTEKSLSPSHTHTRWGKCELFYYFYLSKTFSWCLPYRDFV